MIQLLCRQAQQQQKQQKQLSLLLSSRKQAAVPQAQSPNKAARRNQATVGLMTKRHQAAVLRHNRAAQANPIREDKVLNHRRRVQKAIRRLPSHSQLRPTHTQAKHGIMRNTEPSITLPKQNR